MKKTNQVSPWSSYIQGTLPTVVKGGQEALRLVRDIGHMNQLPSTPNTEIR
jgi:hypothetical protein